MDNIIQIGDNVVRNPKYYDSWWKTECKINNVDVDHVFQVEKVTPAQLRLVGFKPMVNRNRFILIQQGNYIELRIKKLYKKCKTTAHWGE